MEITSPLFALIGPSRRNFLRGTSKSFVVSFSLRFKLHIEYILGQKFSDFFLYVSNLQINPFGLLQQLGML